MHQSKLSHIWDFVKPPFWCQAGIYWIKEGSLFQIRFKAVEEVQGISCGNIVVRFTSHLRYTVVEGGGGDCVGPNPRQVTVLSSAPFPLQCSRGVPFDYGTNEGWGPTYGYKSPIIFGRRFRS